MSHRQSFPWRISLPTVFTFSPIHACSGSSTETTGIRSRPWLELPPDHLSPASHFAPFTVCDTIWKRKNFLVLSIRSTHGKFPSPLSDSRWNGIRPSVRVDSIVVALTLFPVLRRNDTGSAGKNWLGKRSSTAIFRCQNGGL